MSTRPCASYWVTCSWESGQALQRYQSIGWGEYEGTITLPCVSTFKYGRGEDCKFLLRNSSSHTVAYSTIYNELAFTISTPSLKYHDSQQLVSFPTITKANKQSMQPMQHVR